MATTHPPQEPLVAILGTTGTGKSDLAVDLALKFNGEIINADAMQMYKGLPVITNQLSLEERQGVPHHLLATVDHHEPTWSVDIFAYEANKLIREIRSRGKLPIVVGGTHYYLHSLLFKDNLVGSQGIDDTNLQHRPRGENETQFQILDGPTSLMLDRLREVDPVMADRWHPDDRRKIQRSLEIFLTTGRRASDIYAEQKQEKALARSDSGPWQSLMFWVYTEPEVLNDRLYKRVDKMYQNGLMDEVRSLHESRQLRAEKGEPVDLTRGIWQSIGYRQMEPFLDGERAGTGPAKMNQLKEAGLEETRIATRQYAKYQLRWIRNKSIPAFKDHKAMDYLFLLDSSNADAFSADVLEPATDLCQRFLDGQALVKPTEVSDTAKKVLTAFENAGGSSARTFKVKTCDICGISLATEDQWNIHIKGRRHHRALRGIKMTALVPLSPQEDHEADIRI
ncbi:tRNA isopentenyltransferase [Hypoxylon fragiforme]|uniref:tRNA isopentenyltransferase n=1 Tax=Hypoxylon fragiforme TaxID=63214 RepID=UPI0020C5C18D|nr:tRNA isopentenyltransferase [Hypoxylon fragiforme]KAI2608178.1 tRNA isopentenyltransferase [Hypoxylon fragiforme]